MTYININYIFSFFIELYSYTEENDFQENAIAFQAMLSEFGKDSKFL